MGGGLAEAELGGGGEVFGGEVAGEEFGPGGGGDHGGVVGGEGEGWEGDGEAAAGGFGGETAAEFGVGGDATGDDEAAGSEGLGGGEGLAEEVADDGVLEGGDEVEGLGVEEGEGFGGGGFEGGVGGEGEAAGFDGLGHLIRLGIAEDGRFDSAEGEVVAGGGGGGAGFDVAEVEGDGAGVAVGGEGVDPGASGVAEAEEFGDLVEGFSSGVVYGAAYVAVVPGGFPALLGEVEVGVSAGDDEGEEGELHGGVGASAGLHEDGVDVAFEVVDGDEGFVEAVAEGLGVGDADEECSGEAGAFGDGDGVEVGEGEVGAGEGFADDEDDVAEVLAGGEFGDDTAVVGVEGHLGGDDVGERVAAGADDGGGGLVAGGFDAEDETGFDHVWCTPPSPRLCVKVFERKTLGPDLMVLV